MYEFVTHTWNTVKGACFHDCSYCYMKRWGKLNPVRFDEKELKTNLGSGNFIFVGSSCDMWANDIPEKWIKKTIAHCLKFDNQYLFQSKNPKRLNRDLFLGAFVCLTLETNRHYPHIMKICPSPEERVQAFQKISYQKYITIEPVMDFDLDPFIELIKRCNPVQVNIGADSGKNNIPEPDSNKIKDLIFRLECFTKVHYKKNSKRLIKT